MNSDKLQESDAADKRTWEETDEVVEIEVKEPLDIVVPVRMPKSKWEALRREAREIGLGPSTLARVWILERLKEMPTPKASG